MALDPLGNYFASLPDEQRGSLSGGISITEGSGAPTLSTPISPGYIDTATGDFYVNTDGTFGGWVLVTGGVGGGSAITSGAGTPVANGISVVTYKIYVNNSDDSIWFVSNGAWYQRIA